MDSRYRKKILGESSPKTLIGLFRRVFRREQNASQHERQKGAMHQALQGNVSPYSPEDRWLDLDKKRRKYEESVQEGEAVRAIHAQYKEDPEQLIFELRQYIETHPDSDLAYSYLGGTLKSVKRWEESITAYREAERLRQPEDWFVVMTRLSIGDVLREKGDLSAAAREYERITDDARLASIRHEEFPWGLSELAYLYWGKVLLAQGKRRKARVMWKRVVLSSTAGPEARKLLEANPW